MGKPGIMLYFELRPCIEQMNPQEKAEMLDALMDYGEYGQTPELSEKLRMLWPLVRQKLDRDTDRYERTVNRNQYALYSRYAARNNQPKLSYDQWKEQQNLPVVVHGSPVEEKADQTTNYKPQTTDYKLQTANSKLQTITAEPSATRPVFSPPTREDITVYCREMGYSMDADSFLDYYEANGWVIGKSPMKDWRAAVRRWQRKEHEDGKITDPGLWDVGRVL